MKIGIIGAGAVGQTLAAALAAKGHDVRLGARVVNDAELDKPRDRAQTLREWSAKTGVKVATFAEAANHGETLILAVGGGVALEALRLAGEAAIGDKVLIDVCNPLDFSTGSLTLIPSLSNTTSVGEEIQKAYPQAKVVKTLSTSNIAVGVNPAVVGGGDIDMFIAGNDEAAKGSVTTILKRDFGWRSVVDLGDIAGARGMEQLLTIWFRLMQRGGSGLFGFKVVR
ncbi:MAG: NAD(P)-binding domain-containing protein [Roseiarcus sp.]|jgi:predicted dinucleotide-binding enzyme